LLMNKSHTGKISRGTVNPQLPWKITRLDYKFQMKMKY
jgi:hypothetical protein